MSNYKSKKMGTGQKVECSVKHLMMSILVFSFSLWISEQMAFVGRHEIASQLKFHQLIDFQSIDHKFFARYFCPICTTGLKAIKALLSSATFSPNGSDMHSEH